jgi:hypothetical protein
MGYDMFVQGFDDGDAAPMPSTAFDVFRPYVDRTQPEHHFWHLRTPDDGQADIYANVTPGTFDSLMISRFSDGGPLDLLAEFTIRAGAVILAPGGPAMLTAQASAGTFPETPPRLRACFASRQVSRPVGPCGDNVVDRQLDDAAVFQVAGSWGGGVDQGDAHEHPTVVAGAQNGVEGAVLEDVSGVDVSRFINCHDAIMARSLPRLT